MNIPDENLPNNIAESKVCNSCGKTKSADAFYSNRGKCKQCLISYQKQWNMDNPESVAKAKAMFAARNPDYVPGTPAKNLRLVSDNAVASCLLCDDAVFVEGNVVCDSCADQNLEPSHEFNVLYVLECVSCVDELPMPCLKIGTTRTNLKKRCAELNAGQGALPVVVAPIAAFSFATAAIDAHTVEKAAHALLESQRIRGEWFKDDGELRAKLINFCSRFNALFLSRGVEIVRKHIDTKAPISID